jgi:hypothetical protein
MNNKYSVRIFESADGKNSTSAGAIVALTAHTLKIYAYTAGEVETSIRRGILNGTFPFGKVYQICPRLGNSEEPISSIAVLSDGSFERVFLDAAQGYGEFRRIRLAKIAEEISATCCVTERQVA